MNRKIKLFSLSAIAFGMISSGVFATPILFDYEDGDNNVFTDWTVADFLGGVIGSESGDAGAGVALGGQNAIRIAGTTPDGSVYIDTITTDALTGNMTSYGANGTSIAGMRFDFYAGGDDAGANVDGAPSGLSFYFESGVAAAGGTWFYSVPTTSITDGWGTYYSNFGSGGGWSDLSATGTTFADAIQNVTRIGIAITYLGSTAGQVYGLDNFGLTVPEPETYLILGMALLSIAMVFRKKITESLVEARAMLQM